MTTAPLALPAADVIAYVRVSTDDQATERKSSLAQQRAALAALAAQLGRPLAPSHVFEDPGASGGSADRPGFLALIRYCELYRRAPRSPGLVLVLNDARWGRFPDPEEATYWRFHMARCGWHVRFAEGETEDPFARQMLRTVHSAQASAYREAIRANARRGARGTAARGLWQNEAPFGYRRAAARPGEEPRVLEAGQRKADDEETRLVLGPLVEQDLVRWIFARYTAGGISLGLLARECAARWPRKAWGRTTLNALLRNPAYVGDTVWCRSIRGQDGAQRQATPADWVTVRDTHPALVSREAQAAAIARLQINRRQTAATRGGYPLSGLLTCARCGRPYIGGGGPKGPAEDPDRYRFYRDSGADAYDGQPASCPGHTGTLQKRWIEPRVIGAVADVVSHPRMQALIARLCGEQLTALADAAGRRRTELERALRRQQAERDRLVGAIARGLLTDVEAAAGLAERRQQIEELTAELERQRFQRRHADRLMAERDRLVALARDFRAIAARASGAQLRELLRPWLASAVVDKERRRLVLAIRRVPEAPPVPLLATSGGPRSQAQKVVRRVITLPPAITRRPRRVA